MTVESEMGRTETIFGGGGTADDAPLFFSPHATSFDSLRIKSTLYTPTEILRGAAAPRKGRVEQDGGRRQWRRR